MIAKIKEKNKAVAMRKRGATYSEILQKIPVAKSTLSLWFKGINLSKPQKQRLTEKKLAAGLRGGEARRRQRIARTIEIKERARKDIKHISRQELWFMGIMLYWAEGAKEKEWSTSVCIDFANSDPFMIKLFLKWLNEILNVPDESVQCRIQVHENHQYRLKEIEKFWLNVTKLSKVNFRKPNFKKHNPKTLRKKTGKDYYGLLQIRVKKSSSLNRKIAGWVDGIIRYYGLN